MLLPCKNDIAKKLGKDPDDITIGYASTIGDLFHAGHIAYLRSAKNLCDFLIVGIVDDPQKDRAWKNAPVQSLFERYIQIATCEYVDCVIPLSGERDLKDSLLLLQPDVRFVGEEYKNMEFTGSNIEGIEIIYLPRRHSFSSTDLRTRVYRAELEKQANETKCVVSSKVVYEPNTTMTKSEVAQLHLYSNASELSNEDPDLKDVGKQDL